MGWLLGAQSGEVADEKLEPPVAAGLGQMSAALECMAEFLRLDEDLLHVAAVASRPIEDTGLAHDEVRAWVSTLPAEEKDDALAGLLLNDDRRSVGKLLQRFLRQRDRLAARGEAPPRRTVGELLKASAVRVDERRRAEAEGRARAEARRQREAAAERKYLDGLVGREPKLWAEVGRLIVARQPKSYDLP